MNEQIFYVSFLLLVWQHCTRIPHEYIHFVGIQRLRYCVRFQVYRRFDLMIWNQRIIYRSYLGHQSHQVLINLCSVVNQVWYEMLKILCQHQKWNGLDELNWLLNIDRYRMELVGHEHQLFEMKMNVFHHSCWWCDLTFRTFVIHYQLHIFSYELFRFYIAFNHWKKISHSIFFYRR